jgi:hypothetical protein
MPTPDRETMAPRSGFEPECARRARLLALALLLLSACLNPMPEEFPSNDDPVNVGGNIDLAPVDDEANGRPTVPDQDGPGDFGAAGSGGTGGNVSPPAAQPPLTGSDGNGESEAPDAGADAGTPSTTGTDDDTSPEGDTAP